jgi:hypothetical protein
MAMLASSLALACGGTGGPGENPGAAGTPSGGTPTGAVGTHEGAIVRVELRGLDGLSFADGSRVALERFVVHLGGVSLLRDLSDPAASRLDLTGQRLPILPGPNEPIVDKYIIGREIFQNGGFKGIRLELAPSTDGPATSPDDGTRSTLFVQGAFTLPLVLDEKSDGQKISPNPAPIEPTNAQALTTVHRLPFRFQSLRVEDLLVGLGADLRSGGTVVVVFRANYWFSDDVRAFLAREALTRQRLGIPQETELALYGQGFIVEDEVQANIGRTIESNILDSIGFEVR